MTWLPVEDGSRDAVLGLWAQPYGRVREAFGAARLEVDPRVLELCRGTLATAFDLDATAPEPEDELERAAANYAAQFHYDHTAISTEQRAALTEQLGDAQFAAFVKAIWLQDAWLRVACLLDVERDEPEPDDAGAQKLSDAIQALGRSVIASSRVDDYSSEAIRLHNADHQHCLY